MREQFEKLPEVHKKLKNLHPTIVWFCDQENKYASSFEGFQDMVLWLNGAYYAYQEQQEKISVKDELKEIYRKEVDFLRNQTSKAILALYSENKEDALNILKESIKE